MAEHAVIAHLKLSDEGFGTGDEVEAIHELSDQLAEAIEGTEAGEFDGDEFGEGECVLYMYGPDADALFAAIEPLLRGSPLAKGARVVKRYGEAGDRNAKEVSIRL
jgi:hypothetical protein